MYMETLAEAAESRLDGKQAYEHWVHAEQLYRKAGMFQCGICTCVEDEAYMLSAMQILTS